MSKYKVLVTDTVFESFDITRDVLAAVDAEFEVLQCKSAGELKPKLDGVHGLLNTYMPGIDNAVFQAAPNLKAVVRFGIGVDTIDIPAATERGILVANVPDYCIEEVSNHALAHFLTLARKLPESCRRTRTGEWSLGYVKPLKPLQSMRAGIVGFGRIGRAIADRLRPFVKEVVVFDPALETAPDGVTLLEFGDLVGCSDAIFVQCPANEHTHHLFNRAVFEQMQAQPILINCARGEIVDTEALIWALETGKVSAAGLDVLEDEAAVMADEAHLLRRHENVLLTPHSAWFSDAALPALQRKGAEAMAAALIGQRPASLLNPEVLGGTQ